MQTHPSTSVDTKQDQHQHPPQLEQVQPAAANQPARVVRRVGFADRVALRVGLALITWSRRPRAQRPTHGQAHHLAERERYNERLRYLNAPPR